MLVVLLVALEPPRLTSLAGPPPLALLFRLAPMNVQIEKISGTQSILQRVGPVLTTQTDRRGE